MIIDSHAHYDDKSFYEEFDSLMKSFKNNNIIGVVNPGSTYNSNFEIQHLKKEFDFIFPCVGVDPSNVTEIDDNKFEELRRIVSNNKDIIAIGEIGLDYHLDNFNKELQKYWFRKQIDLALEFNKPIIIHDRDAHEDCLKILIEKGASKVGGVFHCYSGSLEYAKEIIKIGFYISVGGVVTFKNAKRLVDIVYNLPIEKILVETDSPYLSPEPFRGKTNNSNNLVYIIKKISEIKEIDEKFVKEVILNNTKRVFNI